MQDSVISLNYFGGFLLGFSVMAMTEIDRIFTALSSRMWRKMTLCV
jgi:hypothetical protein